MMETLTPKERDLLKAGLILGIILIVGVAYYGYSFVKPQIQRDKEQITKLNGQIKKMKDRLHEMDVMAQNLQALMEKQAYLDKITAKLPNSIDAPGFMRALVDILQVTRVEYTALQQDKQAVRSVYTEIPYSITCRTRYHDFGQFLNLVEENPNRFMRVKEFTIENQAQRPSIHPVTVRIATFMFNSKG
jgi:Tfp pilus assembly protein PilO